MAQISDHDLELARQLPDDFVTAGGGDAAYRIIELVGEHWVRFAITARVELIAALRPILEPLLESGAKVSDRERGVCEAIVAKWLERQ